MHEIKYNITHRILFASVMRKEKEKQ